MPGLRDLPCNSPLFLCCSAATDKLQKFDSLVCCGIAGALVALSQLPICPASGVCPAIAHHSCVALLQQIGCRISTAWHLLGNNQVGIAGALEALSQIPTCLLSRLPRNIQPVLCCSAARLKVQKVNILASCGIAGALRLAALSLLPLAGFLGMWVTHMSSLRNLPCNSSIILCCSAATDKLQKVTSLACCGKQWHGICSGCSEPATHLLSITDLPRKIPPVLCCSGSMAESNVLWLLSVCYLNA